MRGVFKRIFLLLSLLAGFSVSRAVDLRIDQDRIWLSVENESLTDLLADFAACGIQVEADPSIDKTVSGTWTNADLENVLDRLISPYDYLLDWQRDSGPLGDSISLRRIRVFQEGRRDAVEPLRSSRRIAVSPDGKLRFIARELIVGFGPGSTIGDLQAFLARTGGTVIGMNKELGVYRIPAAGRNQYSRAGRTVGQRFNRRAG